MSFQFAWVEPAETTFGPEHAREDEEVFAFALEHTEGDFATLTLDIENPRRRLLDGTDIWMWLAEDGVPLFFGRLVAVPEQMASETVRLGFLACPADFDARKRALAETLKTAPFWDPVWLLDERLDDPDAVLEARTVLWHIDRVSHAVTLSDIIEGEDGTVACGQDDVEYASLDVRYGAPPVRRVRVDAEISWDQQARGSMDISGELVAAFRAAGSTGTGLISSFTGQGLEEDWPAAGQTLDGGWSIGTATLQRADGVWRTPRFVDVVTVGSDDMVSFGTAGSRAAAVTTSPVTARFYLREFAPVFTLAYEVARQRIERVGFTLAGDVQRVCSEPGDEEEIVLSLASRKVSEPIGEGGAAPIGDLRRSAYLKTDRGRQSLEYLIALARAKLLGRARAVEIRFAVPFALGTDLSCRHSVTLTDARLPDGAATGKVIGYRLVASGDGDRRCEVTIGCTIGTGDVVSETAGTPDWGDDGYTDDYQTRSGRTLLPSFGAVVYDDPDGVVVVDDGIDLFDVTPGKMVESIEVLNGETAQRAVLAGHFEDVAAAVEGVNAAFTEVVLELTPLVGGPFETDHAIGVSGLMVPRTITL